MVFPCRPFGLLLACAATATGQAPPPAAGTAAFAMTAEEFRRLSPADQQALLARAIGRRLERARNIRYEALLTGGNYEHRDGKVGKLAVKLNGSRLRHWKLDDAYRMDTIRGGDVSVDPLPIETVASRFDPKAGVGISTIHVENQGRCFARIDTVPDPINDSNRYAYWLDGEDTPEQEYFLRHLLEQRDHFRVDASGGEGTIRLTVPWIPYWSEKALGTRAFDLDPRRGFLPAHGEGRWERAEPDGTLSWREEEFFVEDARLVRDVYMPTRVRELTSASTLGDGLVTVWMTEVSKVEAGDVRPRDLEVPLTPGMEVVDAIRKIHYRVGGDGKAPAKVEPLIIVK